MSKMETRFIFSDLQKLLAILLERQKVFLRILVSVFSHYAVYFFMLGRNNHHLRFVECGSSSCLAIGHNAHT